MPIEPLHHKIHSTFRPLYDLRVWLLIAMCLAAGMYTDPAATIGLAGYIAYAIGMWGLALMVSKVATPYIRMSDYARAALVGGNLAAAIVVLARVLLLICIAISLIAWGK